MECQTRDAGPASSRSRLQLLGVACYSKVWMYSSTNRMRCCSGSRWFGPFGPFGKEEKEEERLSRREVLQILHAAHSNYFHC